MTCRPVAPEREPTLVRLSPLWHRDLIPEHPGVLVGRDPTWEAVAATLPRR